MKLFLLQVATMQPGDIPVPAYVIQTDAGTNILIDSGFPSEFIDKEIELPIGLKIEMRQADYVVNKLNLINLKPEDIDFLICSHFDTDHAGNHRVFKTAELIVQREHYELATSGHQRFAGIRDNWDHADLRYRLIDGDVELVPGVELIETSGHVPGHQAVLVRLPKTGPVLLAIDAIPHSTLIDADTREIHRFDMDEAQTRASTRKLTEIARRENVQLIIHGHDSEQWKHLRHAPEFYS